MKSTILVLFSSLLFTNLSNNNSGVNYKFVEFLSLFEPLELPAKSYSKNFSTTLKKIKINKRYDLQSKLRDFIPDLQIRFSRLGPPRIEPVGRFYPSEKHVAVIYKSYYPFGEGRYAEKMVVYDLNGKPAEISIQDDYDYVLMSYDDHAISRSFVIDQTGMITLTEKVNDYEEPYSSSRENKIVSVTTTRESYMFNDQGKFLKVDNRSIANVD